MRDETRPVRLSLVMRGTKGVINRIKYKRAMELSNRRIKRISHSITGRTLETKQQNESADQRNESNAYLITNDVRQTWPL